MSRGAAFCSCVLLSENVDNKERQIEYRSLSPAQGEEEVHQSRHELDSELIRVRLG